MACAGTPGIMCHLRDPDMGVEGNRDHDDVCWANGL